MKMNKLKRKFEMKSRSIGKLGFVRFKLTGIRDIVLYDRIDKYDSLPDKTFAGYQFFAEKCQQRDYVIFHDDDVFIAVNELKSQLKKTSSGK